MAVRRRISWSRSVLLACLLAALSVPASGLAAPQPTQLPLSLCAPGSNTFTLDITNPFFPLPVGAQWVYTGKEQGQDIGLRITVLDQTETFRFRGGVTVITRVVEEIEWFDADGDGVIDPGEELIEVSQNYFAQTTTGTVCYFGEDVQIFQEDGTISTEGSWRADARGNQPGIFMPANPQPGTTFQQEVAPGIAEDTATILRTGTAKLPDGTRVASITVRDVNPLDGSSGTKVYGRGVGLLQDGPLSLLRFTGV